MKIVKFGAELIPKMGLAPNVLKKALPDIFFHSAVFVISMFAFSTMFYINLGSVMWEYSDAITSFISLSRALFGDFDITDIMENSADHNNTILFISYLFVAMFILLSMFFAILGEAQANLRDDERLQAQLDKANFVEPEPEYGVLANLGSLMHSGLSKAPFFGRLIRNA